jgi:hypothetical protein
MTEREIQYDILAKCNSGGTRLWRNHSGRVQCARTGRWHPFGIPGKGGADLIGIQQVVITPEMVGQTVAVFLAVEVKSATGKVTTDQKNFLKFISDSGGLAGIARSAQDAISISISNQPTK